jgi:hypothetical protein
LTGTVDCAFASLSTDIQAQVLSDQIKIRDLSVESMLYRIYIRKIELNKVKSIYFDAICTAARGRVEALCYKPEGRGFETQSRKLIFSTYLILQAALRPGVYSASNIN